MCFLIWGFHKPLTVYWINYCKTKKGLELKWVVVNKSSTSLWMAGLVKVPSSEFTWGETKDVLYIYVKHWFVRLVSPQKVRIIHLQVGNVLCLWLRKQFWVLNRTSCCDFFVVCCCFFGVSFVLVWFLIVSICHQCTFAVQERRNHIDSHSD